MSYFDDIQKTVFSTAQSVFGDTAVWKPSNSEIEQSENVLYNSPDQPISIGSTDRYEYRPYNYFFEYTIGQFPTLKELVDGGVIENITVKGTKIAIREVRSKFDGQTFIAYGEVNND
jgi:hypothetical protein